MEQKVKQEKCSFKNIIKSFVIAFSMYSRVPMPNCKWEEEDMKYVMCFFPWIGLVQGGVFYLVWKVCGLYTDAGSALFRIFCMLMVPSLVTGGIHLDGFMDVRDALSSYGDREEKLRIMKDPHTGAFAVLSVIVYFLAYGAGLCLIQEEGVCLLWAIAVFSRVLSGSSLVWLKNAKKEGLCFTFSDAAHKMAVRVILVLEGILTIAGAFLINMKMAAVIVVAGLGTYAYYKWKSYKEFGGITGDLAGWFLCLCELLCLWGIGLVGTFL